jgi:hypothetical protein
VQNHENLLTHFVLWRLSASTCLAAFAQQATDINEVIDTVQVFWLTVDPMHLVTSKTVGRSHLPQQSVFDSQVDCVCGQHYGKHGEQAFGD